MKKRNKATQQQVNKGAGQISSTAKKWPRSRKTEEPRKYGKTKREEDRRKGIGREEERNRGTQEQRQGREAKEL